MELFSDWVEGMARRFEREPMYTKEDLLSEAEEVLLRVKRKYPSVERRVLEKIFRISLRNRFVSIARKETVRTRRRIGDSNLQFVGVEVRGSCEELEEVRQAIARLPEHVRCLVRRIAQGEEVHVRERLEARRAVVGAMTDAGCYLSRRLR